MLSHTLPPLYAGPLVNLCPLLVPLQIKQAKIARELEASLMSEKALNERVEALEQEVSFQLVHCSDV